MSTTSATSTVHTETTSNTDPRIRVCFDTNCTYPYGATCDLCSAHIDLKRMNKKRNRTQERTQDWAKTQAFDFQPGSANVPPWSHIEPESAIPKTALHVDEKRFAEQIVFHQTHRLNQDALADQTTLPDPPPNKSPNTPHDRLPGNLDRAFVAGAQEQTYVRGLKQQGPNDEICQLCFTPIGQATDQHILRCQYAHEEQQKIDNFIQRQKRQV